MTKTSNPVDQYRRAQRKKEVQKNKTKRITERDAKVAETKTVLSVKAEIDALEKKKTFHDGKLDNQDTQRLERLTKELRIVKEAEEKRRLEFKTQSIDDVAERNEEKFGMYAKYSIYYDPVMNPYGAPPPGQPRLYWAEGGTTTMDVKLAIIPEHLRSLENDEIKGNNDRSSTQARSTFAPRPAHRQGLQRGNQPPPPPPPPESSSKVDTSSLAKRKMKRASIWASQEEIQSGIGESVEDMDPSLSKEIVNPSFDFTRKRKYVPNDSSDPLCPIAEGYSDYRNTDQISRSLSHTNPTKDESTITSLKHSIEPESIQWLYRDTMNTIQGPFTLDQMVAWYQAGYFPPNTLVCKSNSSHFMEIQYVHLDTGEEILVPTLNDKEQVSTEVFQTAQGTVSTNEADSEQQHIIHEDEIHTHITEYGYSIPAVGFYPVDEEMDLYPSAEMYPVSDLYSYPNTDDAYEDGYLEPDTETSDAILLPPAEPDANLDGTNQSVKVDTKAIKSSWKDKDVMGLVPLQIRRH